MKRKRDTALLNKIKAELYSADLIKLISDVTIDARTYTADVILRIADQMALDQSNLFNDAKGQKTVRLDTVLEFWKQLKALYVARGGKGAFLEIAPPLPGVTDSKE
jgi:hypothetical protein